MVAISVSSGQNWRILGLISFSQKRFEYVHGPKIFISSARPNLPIRRRQVPSYGHTLSQDDCVGYGKIELSDWLPRLVLQVKQLSMISNKLG